MDRKGGIMKQIIINISQSEDGETTIIVNAIYDDRSKQKIVSDIGDEDAQFIEGIKSLLQGYGC